MIWLPLLITTFYLSFTVLLFAFGPIYFHLRQPVLFYTYMSLYIFSLVSGYFLGVIASRHIKTRPQHTFASLVTRKHSIFVSVAAIISCFLALRLGSALDVLNFERIYADIVEGLNNPGLKYAEKMTKFYSEQSDKIRATLMFLVAPFKVLFVAYLVAFWKRYRLTTKVFNLYLLFLIYLLPALQTGTNKPVFDLFIFATISLVCLNLRKALYNKKYFNGPKKILIAGIVTALLVASFGFFSLNMEARGGRVDYIETVSPLKDIRVQDSFRTEATGLNYLYVWFSSYLVQGYYGFALSLEEDFSSTFGVGNSIFLTRQVDDFLGLDLATRTFQRKISPNWNESAQWHSFYSYFANDVHFLGVPFVCFLIGFFLAVIWMTFLRQENFWSYLMLPLLALMIIFIPANNQIFGFLESFSAFVFVGAMWIWSVKIKLRPNPSQKIGSAILKKTSVQ